MKKATIAISVLLVSALLGLAIIAARFDSKIVANVYLGPVPVGGLTTAEAEARLDAWWATQKDRPMHFSLASSPGSLTLTLATAGLALDERRSIDSLPLAGLVDSAKQAVGANQGQRRFPVSYTWTGVPKKIETLVRGYGVMPERPRVYYKDGQFQRVPEHNGAITNGAALQKKLADAAASGQSEITVPLMEEPKRVSDQQLGQIDEVVSTFTTHFPVRKKDRNTNIRIASGKINGYVLLPGDTFSFNTVVGKRTIQDGFKTAPVFKNGKHDMGVGGGICQVSSTLYNAALFADLQIMQRHNHSMPVAYLPVGRDATVDYGTLDLAFKNNQSTPIAISSDYEAGKLTFRILGKKDPALSVKIESSDAQTWDTGVKSVNDSSLPAGKTKVLDKGSRGHSIRTFRVVYKDGIQVAREPLGRSYYKGSVREVAVGTKPVAFIPGMALPLQAPPPASAPQATAAPQPR